LNEGDGKLSSRQGSDQADECKISLLTDSKLNHNIENFTKHLKMTLKDNGQKIRTSQDDSQEKERRERLKNKVRQNVPFSLFVYLSHC
jgi:gas vesicle protein